VISTTQYDYDLDDRRTARIVDGVREEYVYGLGESLTELRARPRGDWKAGCLCRAPKGAMCLVRV